MPGPFELKTSTGSVSLIWNNWAMHRFCEMNGNLPIGKMLEMYDGQSLTFKHVITMIQAASEGAGKVISEREASQLIDEGGGLQFTGSQVLEFIQYTMKAMVPDIPADKNVPEEEKKS